MKILATALIFILLLWFGMRRLEQMSLYFPDRQIIVDPRQAGMRFEAVDLVTSDGVRIHAWWIPCGRPKAPVVLFCHGNAGNISHRLNKVARLHKAGLDVLLFDYRGYGQSEDRTPTEKGTYQDAEAAYRYLTQTRGIPPERLFVQGESLGGAVAVETVLHHPADGEARQGRPAAGLILESAFTSTIAMSNAVYPWLPARLTIRYRYDTLSKLPHITIPILFLHSRRDEIVPFFMAEQNYKAATAPKRFVELSGDHNEGYADSGPVYINAIASFVRSAQ